jgi:hypothetical protein
MTSNILCQIRQCSPGISYMCNPTLIEGLHLIWCVNMQPGPLRESAMLAGPGVGRKREPLVWSLLAN